jgi:hypothetical protein
MNFIARSVPEFIASVLDVTERWERSWRSRPGCERETLEVWFRGHSRRSYSLVPGAYRRPVDACSAFHRFRSMATPFLNPKPVTEWEWYFAAQHYGIATRLLDWTEDPLVALHFSMIGALAPDDDPPVVWMMEAASLNAINFGDDQIYVPTGRGKGSITSWLPSQIEEVEEPEGFAELPAAILPPWATPRILAQRGRFTVHGVDHAPIDTFFARAEDAERRGHIATITLARPREMAIELRRLGFAVHRLFPEPERLAEHLRELV